MSLRGSVGFVAVSVSEDAKSLEDQDNVFSLSLLFENASLFTRLSILVLYPDLLSISFQFLPVFPFFVDSAGIWRERGWLEAKR